MQITDNLVQFVYSIDTNTFSCSYYLHETEFVCPIFTNSNFATNFTKLYHSFLVQALMSSTSCTITLSFLLLLPEFPIIIQQPLIFAGKYYRSFSLAPDYANFIIYLISITNNTYLISALLKTFAEVDIFLLDQQTHINVTEVLETTQTFLFAPGLIFHLLLTLFGTTLLCSLLCSIIYASVLVLFCILSVIE